MSTRQKGTAPPKEREQFALLRERLALVRSVSHQIATLTDLDELCKKITFLIQNTFNYYYVSILTVDNSHSKLTFRASAGQNGTPSGSLGIQIEAGEGMVGHVLLTGSELLANDTRLEPRYYYHQTLPDTRAEYVLPLKVEERLLGVLDLQSDRLNAFNETDQLVMRSLADHIAVAIEGTHLYHNLQSQSEQINTVLQISRAISSILDTDELLSTVVDLIEKRFGYPHVFIYRVKLGQRLIIYQAGVGPRSQAMQEMELTYDLDDPDGMIPWVARSGQYLLANDVSQQPLYRPPALPPQNTLSELVLPLNFGKEVLGILDIQSDQLNAFDENQLPLFEGLSANIAVAMRNAVLYRSELWRRQVADSFRDVANLIVSNLALDEILAAILHELERNLPCDVSAIWLLEGFEEKELRLAAVRGVDPGRFDLALRESDVINSWLYQVLESDQPRIRLKDDPLGPIGMALGFDKDYSSLVAPLRSGDEVTGILALAHHTSNRYGNEAQGMTTTFANYAAVAIQNARLYTDAQTQAFVSTVLLQVAEASQSCETIDDLLSTMVRLTPLLVGVKKCAAFLRLENQNAFVMQGWYGIDIPETPLLYFDEASTPAINRLIQEKNVLFIQDVEKELNLPAIAAPDVQGTVVLLPLLARNELLGALYVAYQTSEKLGTEQAFGQRILSILQGIAHQTAVALENLNLLEARQEESYVTAVLLQVAQAVASQNELDDILSTIVHLMPILVGTDDPVIYVWEKELAVFRPIQAYASSRRETEELLRQIYLPGEFKLLDQVFTNNQVHFAPISDSKTTSHEWPQLPVFSSGELENRSLLAANDWLIGFPITVKGEPFGVLLAREASTTSSLRDRRLEIINGVAQQIGLAIQNEVFREELFARERLEREIQLARDIQVSFLPNQLPKLRDWELEARWQTARTVGGDFYDVFRLGRKRLGLVIADVSDKGIPAALYMTVARTLIRANAQDNNSPARVLERVNNLLLKDSQNGMFVTAIYAIVNLESGGIIYANAGHNRPLLIHHQQGSVETLPKGGMALAVLEDQQYQDERVRLQPDDCIFLYTDGVTDNFSPNGEAFGEDRLIQVLNSLNRKDARSMLEQLDQSLAAFRQGSPLSDDITLLTLHRLLEEPTIQNKADGQDQ